MTNQTKSPLALAEEALLGIQEITICTLPAYQIAQEALAAIQQSKESSSRISVPRELNPDMRAILLRADEFTVAELWTMLLAFGEPERDTEIRLLRRVYENARSYLRFNGIDQDRVNKAVDDMDDSVEDVKLFDGGNYEPE